MASSTVKIVEDPNAPKEPDIIDLTSLDDEKEYAFGKQDELDKNKKAIYRHKKTRSNDEKDSAFQAHEIGIQIGKRDFVGSHY